MKKYLDLIQKIFNEGTKKNNRTGIDALSIFGYQIRFNLQDGFPLLTTKKCHIPSIIHELLWFLKGETNVKYLNQNNISIWNNWADKNGNLGPIYGKQWRYWKNYNNEYIDQIDNVVKQLKFNKNSRRIIVSTWNVAELDQMALPPCHVMFQFYVSNNKLSCQLYQRSCDVFLGLPFNIASYALLIHMLADQCNLLLGDFIWTGGDIHIYINHINQAKLQLTRKPRILPKLHLNRKPNSIFEYQFEDFNILGYNPYPNIKATVAK